MQLKTYTISKRDEQFVEVIEPFTLSDFTVQITKPTFDNYRDVEGSISLVMKDDISKEVLKVLNTTRYDEDDYQDTTTERRSNMATRVLYAYSHSLQKLFREQLDYRGIRKQSTKDAKTQTAIMNIAGKMLMEQETIIEGIIEVANKYLGDRVKQFNTAYENYMNDLYSGKNIAQDWVVEHLDSFQITEELEQLNEQMRKLRELRSKAEQKQSVARNRNMYLFLESSGWGEEDSLGHEPLPLHLREKYTELYSENKGFEVVKELFLNS